MSDRLHALLPSRRIGYALGFLLCAALMSVAFYLQYVENMEPCPLCMFQRIAVSAMGWDPLESTCRHASLSIL